MHRLLLTVPFSEDDVKRFEIFKDCDVIYDPSPGDECLKSAEIIMGQLPPQKLLLAENARWVQITSAGANQYTDCPEIFENGLKLTCLSGAFGQSISEFVLTMVLMLYKNMQLYRDNQNACLWKDEGRQETPVRKQLLILGAGNIGTEVARLFRPFRCHITGMRRTRRMIPPEYDDMITMDGLDEALTRADIVIGALPETKATYKLLNEERLELLKPTALLINVGRGTLIDCDHLALMLQDKKIAGAALDVTDPEPLPPSHPLWKCPNCIITPHTTGGSFGHLRATEEVLYDICCENLKRYLRNEPLLNEVDPETGYRKTDNRY